MEKQRAKARRLVDLRRRAPKREPYDVVLIVCEGERTEVGYLKGLRNALHLSSANIEVVPSGRGTDLVSVVRLALDRTRNEGVYDRVYCVFDRDRHANYTQALANLRRAKVKGATLHAGVTNPCFEFWILLRFEYTARPYAGAGLRSPCNMVIDDLRRHLPGYAKNDPQVFERLEGLLGDAIRHGTRLTEENRLTRNENPHTSVHELVDYLTKLNATSAPLS
ncbi:MAG: RloB family protein [Burkholderiales bacterium]